MPMLLMTPISGVFPDDFRDPVRLPPQARGNRVFHADLRQALGGVEIGGREAETVAQIQLAQPGRDASAQHHSRDLAVTGVVTVLVGAVAHLEIAQGRRNPENAALRRRRGDDLQALAFELADEGASAGGAYGLRTRAAEVGRLAGRVAAVGRVQAGDLHQWRSSHRRSRSERERADCRP